MLGALCVRFYAAFEDIQCVVAYLLIAAGNLLKIVGAEKLKECQLNLVMPV